MKAGRGALLLDVRGTGETAPTRQTGHTDGVWLSTVVLGRPIHGMRAWDTRRALDWLLTRGEGAGAPPVGAVALHGHGSGETGLVALLAAATFMFMRQMSLFPAGSEEIGVRGVKLAIALGGNFFLGALMTLGIGLYAPCMILVSLLGMSERTAFPIMMGSCAFLMPVGSLRFIREQAYSFRNAVGLAIGGVVGVYIAAKFFETLDISTVRWLVIVVVLYTAITLLVSASTEKDARRP